MRHLWISALMALLGTVAWSAPLPRTLDGNSLASGEPVSLALSSPGKTVVVFLSAKCPCSQGHEEALRRLYQEYAPQGFQFIGVHSNADEELTLAKSHFTSSALPFPVIHDPQSQIADLLGALKTPHAYVIADRKIVYQGGVDDSHHSASAKTHYLKAALSEIAAGKSPSQPKARALGCIIRRP